MEKIKTSKKNRSISIIICCVLIIGIIGGTVVLLLGRNKLKADFTKLTANLGGAKSVGIVRKIEEDNAVSRFEPINLLSTGSKVSANNENDFEKNLVIASVDENGQYNELSYKDNNKGTELKLGDFNAEVYRMHVIDDFIFVTYISKTFREKYKSVDCQAVPFVNSFFDINHQFFTLKKFDFKNKEILYDRNYGVPHEFDVYYRNTDYQKSYIIHATTGKIYSTEQFAYFSIRNNVIEDYMGVRLRHYDFSVENDELILREIVSNSEIEVENAVKGKDGTILVKNKTINYVDEDTKTIFHKGDNYILDKNNEIYKVDYIYDNINPSASIKKIVNAKEVDVDLSVDVYFKRQIINHYPVSCLKDGKLIFSWANFNYYYTGLPFGFDMKTGEYIMLKDFLDNEFGKNPSDNEFISFYPENYDYLLYTKDQVLTVYKVDWETFSVTESKELVTGFTPKRYYFTMVNGQIIVNELMLSVITPTGTKIYKLVENSEGMPDLVLSSDTIVETNIISIQPLN